ncbi:hypothetical protein Q7P37_004258 [Cladosporium fusiforme]
MSLASTLAAGGLRPASFLPAIKCSDCGHEIEIAAMGDHICEKSPEPTSKAQPQASNPYTLDGLPSGPTPVSPPKDPGYTTQPELPVTRVRAPTIGSNDTPMSKAMRPAPPRINPDAANRPFLAPGLTMSQSPISPASSVHSASSADRRQPPLRSATSPTPRLFDPRPPSPELTGGYDCAFPPFNAGQAPPIRPSTGQGHRNPSGERAPSRGGFRPDRPSTAQGGPVDGLRKPSNPNMIAPLSAPPPQDGRRPSGAYSVRSLGDSLPRPTTASSNRSDDQRREPPRRPSRPQEEVMSPTFLNKFCQEPMSHGPPSLQHTQPAGPMRSPDRSQTLPLPQNGNNQSLPSPGLARASTEPYSARARSPSSAAGSVASTDTLAHPTNQNGGRMDRRLQDAPPVPKAVQEHRQDYSHAPSQSSSSNGSKHSYAGSSVGGPSPSISAASSFDAFSPLREQPMPFGNEESMKVAGLAFRQPERPTIQTQQRSPPRSHARPRPEALSPRTPAPMPAVVSTPEESPIDPNFNSRVSHNQPWQTQVEPNKPNPLNINTSPRKRVSPPPMKPAPPPKSPTDYGSFRCASPSSVPASLPPKNRAPPPAFPPPAPHSHPEAPAIRRPTTPGIRPVCRGCNLTIEGKSVKAADGRLTGRWHKQCFTCRTCSQPFATADFYVIDNQPYCEHHYHEANGSLCAGCHSGIEGQYLETTTSAGNSGGPPTDKKFHPRCFTCVDCKIVLAEDYFEIRGRVYCERHALVAMRAQPRFPGPPGGPRGPPGSRPPPGYRGPPGPHPRGPGLHAGPGGLHAPVDRRALMAERRTTKLMVM